MPQPALWTPDPTVLVGASFDETLTYFQSDGVTPVNLTGYTAKAMWRGDIDDDPPLVSLTDVASPDGQIALGGAAGTIRILINPSGTSKLTLGSNAFDVWLYPPGQNPPYSQPIVSGFLKGLQPVTR